MRYSVYRELHQSVEDMKAAVDLIKQVYDGKLVKMTKNSLVLQTNCNIPTVYWLTLGIIQSN